VEKLITIGKEANIYAEIYHLKAEQCHACTFEEYMLAARHLIWQALRIDS